jgi:fermentation-respiration switch protein FrsA (DUF1100 family)
VLRDRYDSLLDVPALRAPFLPAVAWVVRLVPPAMGLAMHQAAAQAELWVAPEAGHVDLMAHGLMEVIADFVSRHLGRHVERCLEHR